MKRALFVFLPAAALGLLAACTPNDKTTTTDSTNNNAATAADTVGAHQMLAKDAAGVRLDSATTKSATGLGGTGNATSTGATSPQGQ
ncbi:hypothetical protein HHL22_11155 [Hymenobacter sp. RP-2-7]|uniref:Coproporphyrinogen III oxidase n=1 Tax=Hymenobacter polaris TaxID=2682546 RepID=A0A7Y0AE97_9BACT|nr:hypothetical protein [Hymenobacter polaris]NML65764.1 hypothetical protein [Hymenobacter polaris]